MLFDNPPRELVQFLKANKNYGTSERYRNATKAETYYWNLQFEGMADWNANAPLKKKKPRIIVPLYATAINTLERFIWGGNRFPKVLVEPTRKDDDLPQDDEIGPRLNTKEAKLLSTFIGDLIKAAELQSAIREASIMASITTSCAIILGTRGGFLRAHAEPGKHCTPSFDPNNPRKVKQLEVVYQYQQEEPNAQGGTIKRLYWYRRTIDENRDIVYKPALVKQGEDPEWEVDPDLSVDHNLGFCPVQWLRSLPASTDAIDGRPIIDPALYSLIDRLSYGVSQRDRAVEYFQDPQWVRKNVPRSERSSLAKNPGMMWDIPGDAEVEILEAQGHGQDTASKHLDDLKNLFFEAIGIVLSDPNRLHASSHISGTVLEYLHAPMMGLASDLRHDYGNAFIGLINLALRLCCVVTERGEDVWIQNVYKTCDMLRKAQLKGVWLDVPILLAWGSFFSPTVQDQQLKVVAANQALVGGLISKHTATEYIATDFAVFDIDTERQEADKDMAEQMEFGPLPNQTQAPGAKSIGSPAVPKAGPNKRSPGKG